MGVTRKDPPAVGRMVVCCGGKGEDGKEKPGLIEKYARFCFKWPKAVSGRGGGSLQGGEGRNVWARGCAGRDSDWRLLRAECGAGWGCVVAQSVGCWCLFENLERGWAAEGRTCAFHSEVHCGCTRLSLYCC